MSKNETGNSSNKIIIFSWVFALSLHLSTYANAQNSKALSLNKTIAIALENDPWLVGNKFQQDSVDSISVAAGTLPDPKVSVNFANLPLDTFDFTQEPMTQFKVGVSQMFPRGKSLQLKREQLQIKSRQFPYQRADRKAKIEVTVTQLWLEAYKAQISIALIEKDRALFEQLADVAQASYSAALGRTRQQDVIRAQLELTRLDDRLTMLNQKLEMSMQKLSQWLSGYFLEEYRQNGSGITMNQELKVDKELPSLELIHAQLYEQKNTQEQELFSYFSSHPAVLALKQKIASTDKGIELAKQKYKPAWGVNASYGYRGTTDVGINRADFLSVGVSFDVPLFTKNKQDKELESAIAQSEAIQTQEWLLLRKLIASFETAKSQLMRLNERETLYSDQLLPQMREQAEASLTAYTNDDGDFAEVVRSRIAELNAQIDALNIAVDRQKTISQLNYFFTNSNDTMTEVNHKGEQE